MSQSRLPSPRMLCSDHHPAAGRKLLDLRSRPPFIRILPRSPLRSLCFSGYLWSLKADYPGFPREKQNFLQAAFQGLF